MIYLHNHQLTSYVLRLVSKPAAPMSFEDPRTPQVMQPHSPASSEYSGVQSPHEMAQLME